MARCTNYEIKEIISTTLTNDEITPFVNSANLIVTEQLGGESLSVAQLKDIELWLAAHFVAIRDPRVTMEKIGDAEVRYEGKTTEGGFNSTRYGQQAMAMDPTGKLANVGKKKASFIAIDLDVSA